MSASPRPALTTPGVIILQTLTLFLAIAIDITFSSSVGMITGITLVAVFAGGALLARRQARSWSAITPPLAVVVALGTLMPTLGNSPFSPARLSVDILNALAAIAPFLVLGAVATWIYVAARLTK